VLAFGDADTVGLLIAEMRSAILAEAADALVLGKIVDAAEEPLVVPTSNK
jgi:hypothetical protein